MSHTPRRFNVLHIVHGIQSAGLWRHLQAAEKLTGHLHSEVIEIFDIYGEFETGPLTMSVHKLRLPLREYRDIDATSKILEERIAALNPDIVHTYHLFSDVYAIRAAAALGIPVIRTVAGIGQSSWSDPFDRSQARTDWSRAEIAMQLDLNDAVAVTIAVSHATKSKLCDYGFPANSVRVSYLGTNARGLGPGDMRRRSCSTPDSLVIGFMHRLEPVKLSPALVPALSQVVYAGIKVTLVLVDGGADFERMAAEFAEAGVATHILPRDFTLWNDVPNLDCLLSVSRSEGMPLLMLEAMARGVPVIATDVGGVSEAVRHRDTGWLIKTDDPAEIRDALLHIATNSPDKIRMGTSARHLVLEKFDQKNHWQDLLEIYASVSRTRDTTN